MTKTVSIFDRLSRRNSSLVAGSFLAAFSTLVGAQGQCTPLTVSQHNGDSKGSSLPAEIAALNPLLIFDDDFDEEEDWHPGHLERCQHGTEASCAKVPSKWTHNYSSEKWHPNVETGEAFHSSQQISSFQSRTLGGKSYVTYDESYGDSGLWGSDAVLSNQMNSSHTDIYGEVWVKFQTNYRWSIVESGRGQNKAKLIRFVSFTGEEDEARFSFSGGSHTPIFISDLTVEIGGSGREHIRASNAVRCSPNYPNFRCGGMTDGGSMIGDYQPFTELLGDGQWHKWAIRARYNSAPGVADGLAQTFFDDVMVSEIKNVPYLDSGAPIKEGFNTVMIGGNMSNVPAPESERYEQWLAYDDVRVYSLSK